jgi:hypothetical protein
VNLIGNAMAWDESDVRLVPLQWLKPHEQIKVKNMKKLLDMTLRWDGFTKPLIVDKTTGAILDGHHRHAVAIRLDLARIPVIVVDYFADESIDLDLWPASELDVITKQDVVNMALSDQLYPPKTTRHRIADYLPPIHVSLEKLSLQSPTITEDSE